MVVSQFNGTSTPKGSYSAKTGDNDCNVNSSRYSLSTALYESNSLSGQVWTKCPTTRPDTQGRHVEAALVPPMDTWDRRIKIQGKNVTKHTCPMDGCPKKLPALLQKLHAQTISRQYAGMCGWWNF